MIKPITFCIPTAKNEKEYVLLLLKSLKENTQIDKHEILIFIDSDNQHSYEAIVEFQKTVPNLKIYRNTLPTQIGGQRNISLMFDAASNDIVCYLQSDMVACRDFDKHISKNLHDQSIVLTCTRIEPPLHPASPEKIIQDFGTSPEIFKYDEFQEFATQLQKSNKQNTEGHFAPFALHKNVWLETLGGFDTQFRCSREDSDMIIRMKLAGLKLVQTWDASVYHFTCVSSRGKDWFKAESDKKIQQKNILQQYADYQELKRFTRKWGFFGHDAKPIFDIGIYLNIDQFVDFNVLQFLEVYCKTLYLNDESIATELNRRTLFEYQYYTNLRWDYSTDHWNKVKHLFNNSAIEDHIQYQSDFVYTHDINISINYSDLIDNFDQNRQQFISQINQWISSHAEGIHKVSPFTIEIKNKKDLTNSYIKVNNRDLLLDKKTFVFA